MNAVIDKFNNLKPLEKIYLAARPWHAIAIERCKQKATSETKKRFGFNGHNEDSDAFRHCYWSALLAHEIGYMHALMFTNAHESNDDNPPEEKRMDLHNNSVGLSIGRMHFSFKDKFQFGWIEKDEAISNKCYKAYLDGRLINGIGLEPSTPKGY